MADLGIPGFVVRASGFEAPEGYDLTKHIVDLATRHSGVTNEVVGSSRNVPILNGTGSDAWHDHGSGDPEHNGPTVHTTERGSGSVKLAIPGDEYYDPVTKSRRHNAGSEINSAIEEGHVDPGFISPEIHTADLKEGDKVVFASSGMGAPHAFTQGDDESRVYTAEQIGPLPVFESEDLPSIDI